MSGKRNGFDIIGTTRLEKGFICFMAMMLMIPAGLLGQMQRPEPSGLPDSIPVGVADPFAVVPVDTVPVVTVPKGQEYDRWEERSVVFNPDPTRAVWLSALCPGLGQVYNRRYWKLPIVIGAYMGLGYATSWNNGMLTDYTNAYRDLMDNDPNTKSYMNFFAPNVKEESLNKTWLENVFRSRRNYFRRNRDLCIISMVGVYLLTMVDAYVDASLAHFDISPDISLDWSPAVIQENRGALPGVGVQWAFTF